MAEDQKTAPPIGSGITPVYINRFQVWAYRNGTVRVIVGDSIDTEDPSFKFAFVMSATEAKELAETIVRLMAEASQLKTDG
jgi:hypothetical protein